MTSQPSQPNGPRACRRSPAKAQVSEFQVSANAAATPKAVVPGTPGLFKMIGDVTYRPARMQLGTGQWRMVLDGMARGDVISTNWRF
jgi:hypothetical protein